MLTYKSWLSRFRIDIKQFYSFYIIILSTMTSKYYCTLENYHLLLFTHFKLHSAIYHLRYFIWVWIRFKKLFKNIRKKLLKKVMFIFLWWILIRVAFWRCGNKYFSIRNSNYYNNSPQKIQWLLPVDWDRF